MKMVNQINIDGLDMEYDAHDLVILDPEQSRHLYLTKKGLEQILTLMTAEW